MSLLMLLYSLTFGQVFNALSSPIYAVRQAEADKLMASQNLFYILPLYYAAHYHDSPEVFMWVERAAVRFTPSRDAVTANLLFFNKTGRLFLEKAWKHDVEALADPYVYEECRVVLMDYYKKVETNEWARRPEDLPTEEDIKVMIEEINRVRAHERGLIYHSASWNWAFSNGTWLTDKPLRAIIPITPEDDR